MQHKDLDKIQEYTVLYEQYKNLLTQTQRQVFELYYYQDLSYSEIAKIMATSRSAAYDAVKKALAKLTKLNQEIYKNKYDK
ncbi:sigma factor-like helix-turn-helix DNA-binding protein [Mycoplasmopsis bovirhinis]|uniref:sigma factor-like helix-turn-helix DNA-binding protein n=1 Tax=Mycoplasmopsis bovirhinis TaxID=29553 RepID=UPI000E70D1DD|nr:sigma factor-like helix-turn-helix DNA-binding protein [Mycoplasmopsis bovirhinis]